MQIRLQREFQLLTKHREEFRSSHLRSKLNHQSVYFRFDTTVPFRLLLDRAQHNYKTASSSAEKLTYYDAFCMVQECLQVAVNEKLLYGTCWNNETWEETINSATTITGFEALIADWFSSKTLVDQYQFTKEALNYVLNEFLNYLRRGLVCPNEMVGCVAAHCFGTCLHA